MQSENVSNNVEQNNNVIADTSSQALEETTTPENKNAEIVSDLNATISSGEVVISDNIPDLQNPYEIILKILDDKELDLATVELHKVTNEYIAILKTMNLVDWEQATEFLIVAATLLEIKAKHLLPQEPLEDLGDDEESNEEMLRRKLEEYKMFKEVCNEIRVLENNEHFYKAPEETVNDFRYVLKQMTKDNLLDAFTRMMLKIRKQERVALERKIQKDRFTVADKMEDIKKILLEQSECMFSTLFDADYSKSEIISTFQAMLELMKIHFLHAKQNQSFDDIKLTINQETLNAQNQNTEEQINGQVAN